jgi:phage tail tape-measure protein
MQQSEPDPRTAEGAHDQAEALSVKLLELVGFVDDGEGGLIGNVSLAVAGGALGIAAGRVAAAMSDQSFEHWLRGLRGERSKCHVVQLTSN